MPGAGIRRMVLVRVINLVNRAAQSAESIETAEHAADAARELAGSGMHDAAEAMLNAGYTALTASYALLESARAALQAINADEVISSKEWSLLREGAELMGARTELDCQSQQLWGAILRMDKAAKYCQEKGCAPMPPSVQAAAASVYRAALERIEAERRQYTLAKTPDQGGLAE